MTVRPILRSDHDEWRILWDGYNAFYGRSGETALPEDVTRSTWERFFDPSEPVRALVAEHGGKVVGLAHYLFHRSTTRLAEVCYLQDLFTAEVARGQGVGGRLVEAVARAASAAGSTRLYWHTHRSNEVARGLYDRLAANGGFIVYTREL